jgi:hypothetical protein
MDIEKARVREINRLVHMPPEAFNPDLLKPRKRRVLLLASYCETDDPDCSEERPCNECLRMCNVAEVVVGLDDITGQFE